METLVDARGMACPYPVIMTKKALEHIDQGIIITLVDNQTAVENVRKFASSQGCDVEVEEKNEGYYIHIEKSSAQTSTDLSEFDTGVILVTSQFLGQGDNELGKTLMKSFFFSLTQMHGLAGTIIFMNSGVALTTQGSEVLDHISNLEQSGMEVLSCGTCLDYYNLKNQLMAGKVTNMYTILEKIAAAYKVITI
ncbi:MAG: sulfurtransferase-like selenium metabolism protein YedF [Ignavibacteriales bacterium]